MAGHSKWKNIQHRKNKQDAAKGKLFTKLIREMTVAAKMGGGDPASNPRLRAAIDAALSGNMSRDTIDRAIKRGAGGMDGEVVDELRYEGYGAGGVAVIVDCMTNNRNRTAGEVRHAFTKCAGNLGSEGSVGYLFTECGELTFAPGVKEEALLEAALDAGADDVIINDDKSAEVITSPENFLTVKDFLVKKGFNPESSEITLSASVRATVSDPETAEKVIKLIDMLEDLDDVQKVYTNADIPDDML